MLAALHFSAYFMQFQYLLTRTFHKHEEFSLSVDASAYFLTFSVSLAKCARSQTI